MQVFAYYLFEATVIEVSMTQVLNLRVNPLQLLHMLRRFNHLEGYPKVLDIDTMLFSLLVSLCHM